MELNMADMIAKALWIVVALCICGTPTLAEEATYQLSVPDGKSTSDYCVVITNSGPRDAVFHLKWNDGGFYVTSKGVVGEIRQMPPEYPDEPLHRKAWRFVRDHSYHPHPSGNLTRMGWMHCPPLFINSIGAGYCDDTASVCYFLWKQMGYESRVWRLGGHVVPEVKVNGRWEMYDPSFRTHYYDNHGNVPGVEQLSLHTELITKPISPVTDLTNMCYTAWMAAKYSSTSNNAIAKGYMVPEPAYRFLFCIPANGIFVLPLPSNKDLKVVENFLPSKLVANAALQIPSGWKGTINIALVVQSIDGSGDDHVVIKGKRFAVGSNRLQEFIDQRALLKPGVDGHYFSKLEFAAPREPVLVTYLINPLLIRMEHDNQIRLAGSNLSGLRVSLRNLSTSLAKQREAERINRNGHNN